MAITKIGARFVKRINQGSNSKQIVTETLNGKTYTRVIENGRIIHDRVKQITRSTVGNKKVNTITKVSMFPHDKEQPLIGKAVYDRVYSENGSLLGVRQVISNNVSSDQTLTRKIVAKQGNDGIMTYKFYCDEGRRVDSKAANQHYVVNQYVNPNPTAARILYKKKGLPMPNGYKGAKNLSLKEMRNWHFENSPEQPYAPSGLKLEFLDNRGGDGTLSTMNSLDKYI